MNNKQLPLSFQAPEYAGFDNFIVADNQQLVHSVMDDTERLIYIWGESGCGKTHLLQAVTQYSVEQGNNAFYLPLSIDNGLTPQMLEGLELMDLVCLDDLDHICGQRDWEEALFHFFNRMREQGGRLILAALHNAVNTALVLPDLRSRLSWGLTYQLKVLDEEGMCQALKERASQRGFSMSDDVMAYIMKHTTRSLPQLMALLDKLDYASLAEQRKLTIPFVKNFI